MTELLTAAQMRAIEQAAIDSGDVTGLELMERAGQGVVEAIFEEWPEFERATQSACVLCGPGNNGGDGYVVARILQDKGWDVRVLFAGTAENLPKDARTNHDLWAKNNPVAVLTEKEFRKQPDVLIIDALFGTGLSRPLEGEMNAVITHISGRNGDDFSDKLVCIDAPSGLCLDSGRPIAAAFQGLNVNETCFARLTVAFDSPKAGHFLDAGPRLCAKTVIKDIGLESWRCHQSPTAGSSAVDVRAPIQPARSGPIRMPSLTLASKIPLVKDIRYSRFHLGLEPLIESLLRKSATSGNKFFHGHALICSGPATKTGAARLAARGALRIGAGLVTVASPTNALQENAAQLTAIMLREANTSKDFEILLSDDRISSICIGPGFANALAGGGLDFDHTRQMVEIALKAGRATVLDADALSAFLASPESLFHLTHPNTVLTPHEGEFKRLFPDIHAKLAAPATTGPAYSKVNATRDAAKRAGCVVLFKGADTVICDPQGRATVNAAHYERAAPWLATAGSGDVLAGFITGLLARGFAPMQAAQTAAWLHLKCALTFGPGLIAEDIPEQIPTVFRKLGI